MIGPKLYYYLADVVKVIDGDTVDLKVRLGFHISVDIRTRLRGFDAPERGKPGGSEATEYLKKLLPIGSLVEVVTHKDPGDKYGRWLADIIPMGSVVSVVYSMVEAGHVKEEI